MNPPRRLPFDEQGCTLWECKMLLASAQKQDPALERF
jgi:hypothetical protein